MKHTGAVKTLLGSSTVKIEGKMNAAKHRKIMDKNLIQSSNVDFTIYYLFSSKL